MASAESALAVLARSRDPLRRAAAGYSHATPPDVLTELAADSKSGVRRAVAANKSTPLTVLRRLTYDTDPLTRALAHDTLGDPFDERWFSHADRNRRR